MEPEDARDDAPAEEVRLASIELRFFVPTEVADWFAMRGGEHFQRRNEYIRAVLVQLYRKGNGAT